jgi:hypothetical protein
MVDALQAATAVAESKDGPSSRGGSKVVDEDDEEEPNWNDAKRMLAEIAVADEIDAATLTLQPGDLDTGNGDGDGEQYDEDFEEDDTEYGGADEKEEDENSNSLEYSRTQRRVSESKESVRGGFEVGNITPRLEYEGTTKIRYDHINDTTIGE